MRLKFGIGLGILLLFGAPITWSQEPVVADSSAAVVVEAPQEKPLDSTQTLSTKLTELFLRLRSDSTNPTFLYDIAKEYLKLGRYQFAVDFMGHSLAKDPTNMDVLYEKGEVLLSMGKKKSGYEAFLAVMRDFKGQAYLDRIGPRFVSSFKITQLSNNKFNDVMPMFSPDGKLIVFQSDRGGNWDIYSMNPDQGENSVKRLTDDPEGDESPHFSPDGKWVVFTSTRDDKSVKKYKPREIYYMDRLGKKQTRVTSSYGGDNWSPQFLDTTTVVFASDRSDFSTNPFWKKNSGIYTIERSGSFLFKMFGDASTNFTDPTFKSQTNQYVFAQKNGEEDFDLYITSVDIKEKPKNLTNASKNDLQPHVSKNGNFVAFVSDRDGNYEVYRMTIDGGEATRITNEDADDVFPKFNSDGSKIIFCSNRTGNYQMFIASTDDASAMSISMVIATLEKRIASSSDN